MGKAIHNDYMEVSIDGFLRGPREIKGDKDRVADDRGSLVIEKRGTPKAVIPPISLDGTASCYLVLLRGEHPFTDFRQFRRKRLVEVCPAA
jgi:hypothetical protein